MSKIVMFCLALAMGAPWLQTQAYGQTGASPSAGGANPNIIEGCLQDVRGQLAVVDKNNVLHRLSEGKGLKQYLGHEVEVTGTPSTRTVDMTQAGGASSVIEQPVFKVKSVKDIAATCQSR